MKIKFYSTLFVTFLTAIFSISFMSCSSDDDDNDSIDISSSPYQLVGKWVLKSVDNERFNDSRHYIVFEANFRYEVFPKSNPFGFSDTGTWKYDKQNVILNNSTTLKISKLTSTALEVSLKSKKFVFQREGNNPYNSTSLKLIGKWELKTQQFQREEKRTFNDNQHYLVLNADFTFTAKPRNLFEAEKTGGTWSLESNNSVLVFNNSSGDKYKIIQLTGTTLELGWLEHNDVIEKSTFVKAE